MAMVLYSLTRVLHSTVAINAGDGIMCSYSCQLEGNIISNNVRGITSLPAQCLGM